MSALQQEIEAAVASAIRPLAQKIEDLSRQLAAQNEDEVWLSVKEAAAEAGRDEKTILRWISEGLVETRRIGPNDGRLQILKSTLAR